MNLEYKLDLLEKFKEREYPEPDPSDKNYALKARLRKIMVKNIDDKINQMTIENEIFESEESSDSMKMATFMLNHGNIFNTTNRINIFDADLYPLISNAIDSVSENFLLTPSDFYVRNSNWLIVEIKNEVPRTIMGQIITRELMAFFSKHNVTEVFKIYPLWRMDSYEFNDKLWLTICCHTTNK